jgi:hypothetical protein
MPSFEVIRDQISWGAMLSGNGWTSEPGGHGGQSYKHVYSLDPNIRGNWSLAVRGPNPGDTFGIYVTWTPNVNNQVQAHYRLTYRVAGIYVVDEIFVDQTQTPNDVTVNGVGWKKIKDLVHDTDGVADDYTAVGLQLFCDGSPTGNVVADAAAANYQL